MTDPAPALPDPDADGVSDVELVAAVARVVARPTVEPADSFVLHAPLELLARAGLLRHVRQEARPAARRRIVGLAEEYLGAGTPVDDPRPQAFGSPADAATTLVGALADGDLDGVDRAATALGQQATPDEIRTLLAAPVARSLAAAGHASIFLYLLARVAPGGEVTGTLLRGPGERELARHPDWQLGWFDDDDGPSTAPSIVGGTALADALLEVPMLGVPGSDFIYPVMHQAEERGVASRLLAGVVSGEPDVARARVELARVAAWSMLQEPADHAPYGWSHCLTMPQAVTGVAGDGAAARRAVAVGATYVVGFRAAFAQVAISPSATVGPSPHRRLGDAIAAGRDAAAGWVTHAPEGALDAVRSELASRAAAHHDAHLVKYTLACFDAAAVDPHETRLYLAAAASLSAFWAALPSDELVPAT